MKPILLPRSILTVSLMGLFVASAAGLTSPVFAQSKEVLEEVMITGSSIKRVQAEGPLPVQAFSQEDIVRSGATSVTDFVQRLPAMQGFTTQAESVGGSGGGVTTASLHDVGEQYTLVLLNGRRVAPSNSGTTIDLNSIPLTAIERIEVLTDGASALYGADAIAGVVNFILKSGYSPLTVDARIGVLEYGGGQQQNFAISRGWGGIESKGYELFLAASYDKTNRLKGSDREFAKTGIISGTYGGLSYDFFNGSSRSVPPNVDVYGAAIGGLDDDGFPIDSISFSPYYKANGKCPAAHVYVGTQCYFDYTSTVEIAPEVTRAAVYGSGKVQLGDTGWKAFADLAYTDVSTVARIAPYPAEFALDTTNPLYAIYVRPYLTTAQAALVTDVNVKYRLYDLGNRTNEYSTKSLHVVTGVEGSVAGWDVSGALTASNQTQDENYLGGYPLADKFNTALSNGSVNPFPYIVGTMPANQIAALRATQYVGKYSTDKISMMGIDGNMQRELFSLPGGDFVASLGVDYRNTGYKKTPTEVAAEALILFDDPQPKFDLSRSNLGAYAEILAPVRKTIDLTAAARYDQISGVKDKASGVNFGKTETAATYKVGAKWQSLDTLALRASYGTGFRTATMKEIAQPKVDFGVTGGTYDCPFNGSYDPRGYIAAGYVCPNNLQFEMFQGGNPDLKPEKSNQWNVGLVWEPLEALSVGLNYWSVDISDAVSSVSERLILENPAKYLSLYTTKYKSSNGKTYVSIIDAPINIGRTQNRGLDWDLDFKKTVAASTVHLRIAGTHLDESRYTLPGTDDQWTSSLGKYGVNEAVSFPNIVTASASIEYGQWEHTLSMNSRDGYKDVQYSYDDCVFYDSVDCVAAGLNVPSYTTYNWSTKWLVEKNTTLIIGIENLFNEEPPRSLQTSASHALGYDPRYASPNMRALSLAFSKKY